MMKFCVRGLGEFPLDMLRHDECEPATDADRTAIQWSIDRAKLPRDQRGEPGPITVHLLTNHRVTPGRWASFGWQVLRSHQVSSESPERAQALHYMTSAQHARRLIGEAQICLWASMHHVAAPDVDINKLQVMRAIQSLKRLQDQISEDSESEDSPPGEARS